MKSIIILVLENATIASIADPRDLFLAVNSFLKDRGQPAIFNVRLAGLNPEVALSQGLFNVQTQVTLKQVGHCDLIIIPAFGGDIENSLAKNAAYVPWLQDRYRNGTQIASLCDGAFLLASTGLLDDRPCSTHWIRAQQFQTMYPQVKLVGDRVITEHQGIYSSGGANSYWNLLLHLVEKFTTREMAIFASKYFAIDIGRRSQASFAVFRGNKEHHDEAIRKSQAFLEAQFTQKLRIDELSREFALSRRSFERRFKQATGTPVMEYVHRLRIDFAKKELESTGKSVGEIGHASGYANAKSFRQAFRRITGMLPLAYRDRFTRKLDADRD